MIPSEKKGRLDNSGSMALRSGNPYADRKRDKKGRDDCKNDADASGNAEIHPDRRDFCADNKENHYCRFRLVGFLKTWFIGFTLLNHVNRCEILCKAKY